MQPRLISLILLATLSSLVAGCAGDAGASDPVDTLGVVGSAPVSPAEPLLVRTDFGTRPGELQTRSGGFTATAMHGRTGERVTATFDITQFAGWVCRGQRLVAAGVRQVSITSPPGTRLVRHDPAAPGRASASVTSGERSVTWSAGGPLPGPADCGEGSISGPAAPTGFYDAASGHRFSATFEVVEGSQHWSEIELVAIDEQGVGRAALPFLSLELGEYARLFEVSSRDVSQKSLFITASDWEPAGGDIRVSIGGKHAVTMTPGQFAEAEFTTGGTACGLDVEAVQGDYMRRVAVDCSF